jgi:mannosyltransferase PIG-V
MSDPAPAVRPVLLVADAATLALALAAVTLFGTGGYRDVVGGIPVSIDWTQAAFAAAGIAAIRHAAAPRPSLASSIRRWRDGVRRRPPLADAALAFWLTRPAVVLVGLLATASIGLAPAAPDLLAARDPLRALPARWDAQWYAGIAAHGYEWQQSFDNQQNLAFFPAYPLLMRAAGLATGAFSSGLPEDRRIARLTWCGLWISLSAFFWAAWYFARLAREMLDPARARAALLLLAAYPFALFFSAAYTESLFLLAALGTWFHFRRGDPWPVVAWGLLAGLTRPNGCFLSIPLGLLALGVRDAPGGPGTGGLARRAMPTRLLFAAMPGIGMLLFTVYTYRLTGIWLAWSRTHAAWGRVLGGESPLSAPGLLSVNPLTYLVDHPYDLSNALALVFVLALSRAVWRLSPAWAVFVLVCVAVPFSAGGLLSMGRLTSTLFPIFLAAAGILPGSAVPVLAILFAVGQGLLAALFYTWRGIY